MNINLAVTGNPVLHSKSPFIFNILFEAMDISNAFYTRLASSSAYESIEMFKMLDLKGMNVTAPFKEDIMQYLDKISDEAKSIGGVNTIVNYDNKLTGYNTDYIGVYKSFTENNIMLSDKEAVVLGAGGAAKAAIYGLIKNNANVTIVNRTLSKAFDAAGIFGCNYGKLEDLPEILKKADIIVSTLSGEADIIDESWLRSEHIVFDANYKFSKLIVKAKSKKCTIIKGESWLINQALPAFEYFLNIKPQNTLELNSVFEKNLIENKKNILLITNNKQFDFSRLAGILNYKIIKLCDINEQESNNIMITDFENFTVNKLNNKLLNIMIIDGQFDLPLIKTAIKNVHLIINGKNKSENEIIQKIIDELK